MTAMPMPLDPTSDTLHADPPAALVLHPLEHIRRQVAAALFDEPHAPSTIGRFQVLRVVGAGGMGVVYAARDPQLDRTVALKLLNPDQLGAVAQQRMLREAQAMARLQHPNVLAVHDAGVHAGQVWIAMEYASGGTLGDWLRAAPRRSSEVVEVLLQAGRGLAAAHAVGLVHRDFKPANILVGEGRIRISDFGLARLGDDAAADFERTADTHSAALAEPMTRTGAVLGTPAYMAPEQLASGQVSARSDQFAFCVVLFEALHGYRPFRGDNLGQLREAYERGSMVRMMPSLPRALRAVLARGLAIDPARRFPTMDALLDALGRVRAGVSWSRTAGMGVALVGAGVMFYMSAPPEPAAGDEASVAVAGDPIGEVWNQQRERELRLALPDDHAEIDVFADVLDAYAARWREVRTERAVGGLDGGWTETCLTDRLRALDDLLVVVAEGTRETAKLVVDATEFLPDPADCARPSLYNTLTSQGFGLARREGWRARRLLAGGMVPRALHAVRLPEMGKSMESLARARLLGDGRLEFETDFAGAMALYHHEPAEPNTFHYVDPRTGEEVLYEEYQAPPRERSLKSLRAVAEQSAAAGYADVAARAWAAVAELLEAGPHADGERVAAWDALRTELAKLPAEHRLRRRLTVDLAVVEAAHARHAAPAGSCPPTDKFGACESVHRAIDDFTAAIAGEDEPSRLQWLVEQLAQTHEYAGDAAAAAAVRAANPGTPDRRTPRELGYLDFAAGTVVTAPLSPAEAIRCTYDHSRCEIDPSLVAGDFDAEALLEGAWLLPNKNGLAVRNLRDSAVMRRLDIRHRDVIVAVDGVRVGAPEFVWDRESVLNLGRLSLTLERGGATLERELVLSKSK